MVRLPSASIGEMRALEGGERLFKDAVMQLLTNHEEGVLRSARTGAFDLRVPEHLRADNWVEEPKKVLRTGEDYGTALAANRRSAQATGSRRSASSGATGTASAVGSSRTR